jgi:hypothetical protein
MNVRKHLAGFTLFSVILGSAILINHFLTIPYAAIPPVQISEATPVRITEEPPVTFHVRQISLDYINRKSYTELSLFRQPDQPAPETVWVKTTYFSPDSTRAQIWTTIAEIRQPFSRGNGQVFVATADWELPPSLKTPGDGYFARVSVSTEAQGTFYPPDYQSESEIEDSLPVVVHWPEEDGFPVRNAKKFSR